MTVAIWLSGNAAPLYPLTAHPGSTNTVSNTNPLAYARTPTPCFDVNYPISIATETPPGSITKETLIVLEWQ